MRGTAKRAGSILSSEFATLIFLFVRQAGMAYLCFITDAFSRMIVGWRGQCLYEIGANSGRLLR